MLERDRQVLWHPFTQHGADPWQFPEIIPVKSGQGSRLVLENGQVVLDAISSWWVNLHGHAHPRIAEAIARQARELEHVVFAGFTHEPAIHLAELLASSLRERGMGECRVFYSDNGSTAVEVALKIAYQFHQNRGDSRRTRFLALKGGYHGDTLGCMAVGRESGFHDPFRALLPEVDFVEPGDIEALSQALERNGPRYAAFIAEPLVQGARGMRLYPAAYLTKAWELCRSAGILTIADEVFTGFYRTGKLFAFEHAQAAPDILCVAKGLTGGFLPLSATVCRQFVFDAFRGSSLRKAFLHGHSYTANPIACAAALASWELTESADCLASIERIERRTQAHCERLRGVPQVKAAWSFGTIGAIELASPRGEGEDYSSSLARRVQRQALARGVLLRPLGPVIYTVPPYCMTLDELDQVYQVIEEEVRKC